MRSLLGLYPLLFIYAFVIYNLAKEAWPMLITIDREFGSGGRELGRRLAEELGIAYYDKEIVAAISKKTDYCMDYIEQVSESKPVSLLPIHYGQTLSFGFDQTMQQNMSILEIQNEILADLSNRSSCIIIGRAADYILRDMKPFRIFVYANDEYKINRFKKFDENDTSEKVILRKLKEVDKNRMKYYEFVTAQKWGDRHNYDLLVDSSSGDMKLLASSLALFLKKHFKS